MAREAGSHLGRSAVMWWRHGDEDMVEWNERKGDHMIKMAEYLK